MSVRENVKHPALVLHVYESKRAKYGSFSSGTFCKSRGSEKSSVSSPRVRPGSAGEPGKSVEATKNINLIYPHSTLVGCPYLEISDSSGLDNYGAVT